MNPLFLKSVITKELLKTNGKRICIERSIMQIFLFPVIK